MTNLSGEIPHYHNHRARLRNKFDELNIQGLYEYEIVELLLTFAIPQKDVKPIAKKLLEKFGSIKGIMDAPPEELKKIPYVKDKTITLIKFIKELTALYYRQKASEVPLLDTKDAIKQYCIQKLGHKLNEEFHVLFLDGKLRLIADNAFNLDFKTEGTVDRAPVYPRRIMEEALKKKAHALILVHNHTSGSPKPSAEDITITKAVDLAAKSLGISVFDHFIVAEESIFSFRENRLL